MNKFRKLFTSDTCLVATKLCSLILTPGETGLNNQIKGFIWEKGKELMCRLPPTVCLQPKLPWTHIIFTQSEKGSKY